MSFPDPLPPFVPPPSISNGFDYLGFWPQIQMDNDQPESHAQFDFTPPFKRPRNSDNQSQTSSINPRTTQPNHPINKPVGKIFFKTRLCAKFRIGQCKNGENCNFAHGEEDLRKPPPNWQELVAGGIQEDSGNENWNDDERIIHRMRICKKFYNGEECPYGERCNFLHRDPPSKSRDVSGRFRENVHASRESYAISIGTITPGPPIVKGSALDQSNASKFVELFPDPLSGNMRPVYWKRRPCTKWEMTGQCPFGEKCHYTHGQAELQAYSSRATELEPLITASSAAKPLPAPANELLSMKTGAVSDQEGQGKKCLLKWKGTKKINCIYGDWIDDLPLEFPDDV
ncbi:hypothetical protein Nepgr_032544 [Nepenthes gracilis]|uniref:C3H1-type domain-containing protein n=1 Tax=Nepenthes gracilis TaxID=150966 RepID=A0AAD3TK93_NEPGR|nr:hypothetical protein Nepgr_032544 [Nepenthes gracilis]